MQTIEKIFVDADDEIIFVVEKILRAATDRVILVIPASSGVVSSVISLKLLSRQLLDSNKLLILVTDNPTGKRLAAKSNLVVRDKISLVDKMAWDEALAIKKELREHKAGIKQELLSARVPEELEEKVAEEVVLEQPAEEVKVEEQVEAKPEPEVPTEKELFGEKPRLKPKIVNVGGIPIVSGGDISDLGVVEPVEASKEDLPQPIVERIEKQPEPEKTEDKKLEEKELPATVARRLKDKGLKPRRRLKKILLIILLILGIFLLLAGGVFAYSYKSMASVDIDVSFNQSEGTINETITVSTTAKSIDSENLIIPGYEVSLEESSSGDGEATGKKETGEYAQGLIDIRNKSTESAVNLSKGQIMIDISTNLQYELVNNVTIAVDQYQRDIPVRAKNYGEEYNISNDQTTFRAEGFTTDQLIGFGFRGMTGGKTEEITVVTAEDIDKVKKSLEAAIKGNLTTNLKSQVGKGEVLLENSGRYEEVSFTQSVPTNEEAENFSADLKLKVTAVKVREDDVKVLAAEIIKKSERATNEAEVTVDDFEIKNIKVDGTKVTFDLSAQGEVNENLKLEEQKSQIAGKSLAEAEAYLESLDQIDQVTITYSPDFIPQNLRKIPTNSEKIKFK